MGSKAIVSFLKMTGVLAVTGTLLSCGGNVFEAASSKTSRNAIIEQVRQLTNELRYDEAITIIEDNPTLVPNRDDKLLFASAYAGSCGLTFASIFNSLATASGSPMEFAKDAFTTTPVMPDDCYESQLWIESIGDYSARTTNENIAMFLIGLAKVGTYLRNRADTDRDGVLDAGYDSCDNIDLPIAEVKQIVSGFGLMIENIDALGTSISGGFSTDIGAVGAVCGILGLDCTETNPTLITDGDANDFRDAIKSDSASDLGIESCAIDPTCCL